MFTRASPALGLVSITVRAALLPTRPNWSIGLRNMKETSDTAASRPPSNLPSFEYVQRNALAKAQDAAAELRAMFEGLTPVEVAAIDDSGARQSFAWRGLKWLASVFERESGA